MSALDSQLLLAPIYLLILVALVVVLVESVDQLLRLLLREEDPGSPLLRLPRRARRWRRLTGSASPGPADLQRALLEGAARARQRTKETGS